MNARSILVVAAVVVLGVFAVVGVWYFFEVGLPTYYQEKLIMQSGQGVPSSTPSGVNRQAGASASSTASTTFFGGVVKVATTTPDPLSLLLYPNSLPAYSTGTISVIGIVQSSPAPLTNILTDPRYAGGLSSDTYFKVDVLESWASGAPQPANGTNFIARNLDNQSIDIVAGNTYMSGISVLPGNLILMQVSNCALYNTWPNFTCTNTIMPPEQWTVAPNNLFVSWQGQNGAMLSLAGASLDTFASNSVLSFEVNATSGYGEFCPSSLLQGGPALVQNERGTALSPTVALPSTCIGPNATSVASAFLPFPTTTSTVLTINVLGQDGASSQTFFDLYPLPDGQLFLINASTSDAGGQ